jgi:hypothetical protein
MKSPLLIGLLALAVTGVSAYDYYYFTRDQDTGQPSIQAAANTALIPSAAPVESTPAEGGDPAGAVVTDSLPRISRDEIQKLAQQPFVSGEAWEAEEETAWPRRDPFSASRESAPATQNAPIIPTKEISAPQPLPEPECVFSGTLIDQKQRLALVNGVPLSVGDRLGAWLLARIEPDYIILEVEKETRRIELKGSEPQISRRKDPS